MTHFINGAKFGALVSSLAMAQKVNAQNAQCKDSEIPWGFPP